MTVDGRLYDSATPEDPLLDNSVLMRIQILNPAKSCILYEEQQIVSTLSSNGYFNVRVGSPTSGAESLKRTTATIDVGNSMRAIFQNQNASIAGKTAAGAVCGYTPAPGDTRYFRYIVTPSTTGVTSTLSPDMQIDSVPQSLVAESLQGMAPDDFVQITSDVTQAKVNGLFGASYTTLTGLLAGSSSLYLQNTTNGTVIPSRATNPLTPAAGQIWYDNDDLVLRYFDGSVVQTIGTSGGDPTKLPLAGGTMAGAVDMGNNDITNIGHVTQTAQRTFRFGVYTTLQQGTLISTPLVAGHEGTVWYNTTTNKLMFWDGASEFAVSPVDSVFGRTGAVVAATSDYDAVQIDNAATGNIAATNVQAAIDELDSEKVAKAGDTMTGQLTMGPKGAVAGDGGAIAFTELAANGINTATIRAPDALIANYILTLPLNDGDSGQYLQTDGNGLLAWVTPASVGEVNTASNQGVGGVGFYDAKSGVDLQFRNINAASNKVTVALDAANREVDINVNEANFNLATIPNTAAGTIAATNAQAAINELDSEKVASTRAINTAAGSGLSGGGDLSADRSLSVNINGTTAETVVAGADEILIYDVSATVLRKMTRTNFVLSEAEVDTMVSNNGYLTAEADTLATVTGRGASTATSITLNTQAQARFADAAGGEYAAIQSPATIATNYVLTLPTTAGTANQVLTTDGTGLLSWTTPASAGEVNTASNQGVAGIGLFDAKSGVDLQFRNINAASNKVSVALDAANKEVDINVNEANFNSATIPNTAAGNIAATNVQGAINELDTEKVAKAGDTMTGQLNMGPKGAVAGDGGAVAFTELSANGVNTATIRSPDALIANYVLTLPLNDGDTGQYLQTDGNGVLAWVTPAGVGETNTASNQGVGGVGVFKQKTTFDLEFRSINAASNKVSVVLDAANNEIDINVAEANFALGSIPNTAAGNIAATNAQAAINELDSEKVAKAGDTMTGQLNMGPKGAVAGDGGAVAFTELAANGVNIATIRSPDALLANYVLTLPVDDGVANQVLTTDGAGLLSWTTPAVAGEVNTASNQGVAGVGLYDTKVGVDIQFRNINAASNKITVALDAVNKEVDINVNEANFNLGTIPNTAAGNIAATNAQAAINELDSEKVATTRAINTAAGSGLSGGGDLSADRSLSININGTTAETVVAGADEILIYDASATVLRKMTRTNFVLSESEVDAMVSNNGYLTAEADTLATVTGRGASTATSITLNTQAQARFADAAGGEYAAIQSPATIATNYVLTLPTTAGTANQVLTTDGAGILSWTTPAAAGEVNTASNQGVAGVGLFDAKSGVDLQFRNINAASNKVTVALDAANKEVDINVNEANFALGTIPNTAAGNIAATNAQSAINELDSEKVAKAGDTMTGQLNMGPKGVVAGDGGAIAFTELAANGINTAAVRAPDAMLANYVLTLPDTAGASGQVLSTNGTGVLSWVNQSSIADDSLNFDKFSDALVLDASTDIGVTGANVLSVTNTGTGDSLRVNDQAADTSPFVIDASGNVGIGTTTAGSRLEVRSSAISTTPINVFSSTGLSLFNITESASSNGTLEVRDSTGTATVRLHSNGNSVLSGGNVGVGLSDPGTQLEVKNVLRIRSTSGSNAAITNGMDGLDLVSGSLNTTTALYGTGIKFMSKDTDFVTETPKLLAGIFPRATETYNLDTKGGMAIDFSTAPNNVGATSIPTVRMSIDHDGEVGIGTTTPGTILDVAGAITARPNGTLTGQTGQLIMRELAVGGTDTVAIRAPDAITTSFSLTLPPTAGTATQVLTTDGAGLLSWTSSGAASIANDSLDFSHFADAMTLDASTDVASSGTNVLSLTNTGTGNSFLVNDQAADTSPFVIDASGNVGIGTTLPSFVLSVSGQSVQTVGMERHTTIDTAGNDLTIQAGGATVGATDKKGGNLILSTGTNTGNAGFSGSDILFKAGAQVGAGATVDVAPTTVMNVGWYDTNIPQVIIGSQTSVNAPLQLNSSSSTDYIATGAANTLGQAFDIGMKIKNTTGEVDAFSFLELQTVNGSALNQNAYIGAVSTLGAAAYSPNIIFGMSTGVATRAERMRIESNGNIGIGTTIPGTILDAAGAITSRPNGTGTGQTGQLIMRELAVGGTDTVAIRAPDAITTSFALTLPATAGAANQVLTTDGSGVLSWSAPSAASSVAAGNGTVAAPSISFSGDPDTGFYSNGVNTIGISAGNSNVFNVSSAGIVSPTVGGAAVSSANGTVAAPAYAFAGDPDTGWFRPAADTMAASIAGAERMRINNNNNLTTVSVEGGVSSYGFYARNNFYESWFEDMNNTNDTQSMANFWRSRNDATPPGAGFAGRINFILEGFSEASIPSASEFIWGWENAQTNDTTDRDSYLAFTTMTNAVSTEKLRMTSAGNVGIGTTTPDVTLHPVTNDAVTAAVTNVLRIGHDTSGVAAANYGTGIVLAGETTTTVNQDMAGIDAIWTTATHATRASAIRFSTLTAGGALTEKMRIDGSGFVGILNAAPSVALDVTGDVEYSGTLTDVSDRRMKENILPLDSALDKLLAIEGVSFVMKNDPDKRKEIGVIAQDVETVFPELVRTKKDAQQTKSVNYMGFIGYIIEAIKELHVKFSQKDVEHDQQFATMQLELQKLQKQNQQLLEILQKQQSEKVPQRSPAQKSPAQN